VSYHIHINDEAGLWSCQGPFEDRTSAVVEIVRITKKRQDGPWKRVRGTDRWVKKNSEHYIEVVNK